MKCYFIVASSSIHYIYFQSEFIFDQIKRHTSLDKVEFIVTDDFNFEELEPFSVVFRSGKNIRPKNRNDSIYLVLLNYSPIEFVDGINCDELGNEKIAQEQSVLMEKISNIDCLLDFGKWQPEKFKEKVSLVSHFYLGTAEIKSKKREIKYDVGFVGELTPRRIRIFEELSDYGLKLSPFNGVEAEKIINVSRIAVNLRSYDMPNLEIPRILAALANSVPLISETSNLNSEIDPQFFTNCTYEEIVPNVLSVDRNIKHFEKLAMKGHEWYKEIYLPAAETSWELLLNRIEKAAINKFSDLFSDVFAGLKNGPRY